MHMSAQHKILCTISWVANTLNPNHGIELKTPPKDLQAQHQKKPCSLFHPTCFHYVYINTRPLEAIYQKVPESEPGICTRAHVPVFREINWESLGSLCQSNKNTKHLSHDK